MREGYASLRNPHESFTFTLIGNCKQRDIRQPRMIVLMFTSFQENGDPLTEKFFQGRRGCDAVFDPIELEIFTYESHDLEPATAPSLQRRKRGGQLQEVYL